MVDGVRIVVNGCPFFLHGDRDYDFPNLILEHLPAIKKVVELGRKLSKNVLNPDSEFMTALEDLKEFKEATGIKGFPFDLRDADLYILTEGFSVIEVDLEGNKP